MDKPNARRSTLKRFIKGITKKAIPARLDKLDLFRVLTPKVSGGSDVAQDNKEKIRDKLRQWDSRNVSSLPSEYYPEFYAFILNLPNLRNDEN